MQRKLADYRAGWLALLGKSDGGCGRGGDLARSEKELEIL
jgi:hypothetical protein